jgi:hypothetical protein
VTRQLLGYAALILAALVVSPVASAEPGAYTDEDEMFYGFLTEGGEDMPGMVLTNPPLVRAQALQACQRIDDGAHPLDATAMLVAEGPYSWDTASTIVAAATVFYCIEHVG